jgi:putative RNA 2'-phosphotransferase
MDASQRTRISKYLSKHLRHAPEKLGLTLAPGGWIEVDELLAACAKDRLAITREQLDEVVATSDKQRFSFDPSGRRIRANQGHSTAVDLQLQPATPPDVLYHGTAEGTVALILAEGLARMSRHHVHLSLDVPTALMVGTRHGRPVILAVEAAAMVRDGHTFYRSDNGVWLADAVPARYLRQIHRGAPEHPTS